MISKAKHASGINNVTVTGADSDDEKEHDHKHVEDDHIKAANVKYSKKETAKEKKTKRKTKQKSNKKNNPFSALASVTEADTYDYVEDGDIFFPPMSANTADYENEYDNADINHLSTSPAN